MKGIRIVMRVFPKTRFVFEKIFLALGRLGARITAKCYHALMVVQWEGKDQPEHFNHHIDLYYQWLSTRNSLWIERGAFGSLGLKGGSVLEIACGDGFNARNFYSLRSKRVLACDFDSQAIATAKRNNLAPNVEFVLADIRKEMPVGIFENIIFDAAIEHFTPAEIESILASIKTRLSKDGVLSGYTIVEASHGKSLSLHEFEFKSKEDLLRFLRPHFKNVTVFETKFPSRHNLYFWASDNAIPFHSEWSSGLSVTEKTHPCEKVSSRVQKSL